VRTIYLGTSDFAAGILAHLAAGPHRPALVITRPDRPRGRGRRMQAPPVADRARALGLELFQPDNLHEPDPLERIAALRPEILCVCAYAVLIREPLLSSYEVLNVHPSLLPRWRGAAPIERAIMAGDPRTGVSIMRLEAGLDSGPVSLQETEVIRAEDDFESLSARLESLGGELLVRALDERPPSAEQPAEGVTYAEKIEAADRTLDPERSPEALECVVRGLRPHIGARVRLPRDAGFLGVVDARPVLEAEPDHEEGRLRVVPGPPPRLLLECRGGALELTRVQPPGGRAMPGADWLRGRPAPY